MKVNEPGKFRIVVLGWVRYLMHILPVHGWGRLGWLLSKLLIRKSKVCVPLRVGGKMVLDFQNKHEVGMYFDLFDKNISKLMESLLAPGDTFVDCGANIGYFSFSAATIVSKAGRVIAIDANPYCVQRMEESKASGRHDNVQIIGIAVGESEGQLSFNIANDPMYSSTCDTNGLSWTFKKETIDVKVETLDKILDDVMYDSVLFNTKLAEKSSTIIQQLNLSSKSYYLATIHRAENTDDLVRMGDIFAAFARLGIQVIFPMHPRTRNILGSGLADISSNIRVLEPVSYLDMLVLEKNSRLILTDSGGVQKEAYWFSVPCVTLRDETEWVELVQAGCNQVVGTNGPAILAAVQKAECQIKSDVFPDPGRLYGRGDSADKIVGILTDASAI